jgi:hypothetical protein
MLSTHPRHQPYCISLMHRRYSSISNATCVPTLIPALLPLSLRDATIKHPQLNLHTERLQDRLHSLPYL